MSRRVEDRSHRRHHSDSTHERSVDNGKLDGRVNVVRRTVDVSATQRRDVERRSESDALELVERERGHPGRDRVASDVEHQRGEITKRRLLHKRTPKHVRPHPLEHALANALSHPELGEPR